MELGPAGWTCMHALAGLPPPRPTITLVVEVSAQVQVIGPHAGGDSALLPVQDIKSAQDRPDEETPGKPVRGLRSEACPRAPVSRLSATGTLPYPVFSLPAHAGQESENRVLLSLK